MDERMREPFHALMWKASIGYSDSWSKVDPEVLENFAELIIKECVEISLKSSSRIDDMGSIIAKHIKDHFGVNDEL